MEKMNLPDPIEEDVPIGPQTTLGVGGAARYFAACDCEKDLQRVLQWSKQNSHCVFVLGGGSNVVVADAGFDGVVVKYKSRQLHLSVSEDYLEVDAGAGAGWDELVQWCVDQKGAGIECLSGIPGLVGAAPIQNIGAYGQEVAATIVSVTGIDRVSLHKQVLPASACGFGYRTSYFKSRPDSFIVTAVRFRLARSDVGFVEYPDLQGILGIDGNSPARPTLAETRDAVISVRRAKSMVISPDDPNRRSAGSFFLNPVLSGAQYQRLVERARKLGIAATVPSFAVNDGQIKIPAAWLIEQAGYKKGTVDGNVGLSSRHALAVINRGGAMASDIVKFAARIRMAVKDTFGVSLQPEPVFVGFDSRPGTDLFDS